VEPCPDLQPELAHGVEHGHRATDRASGPIEGREEAVAQMPHFSAAEPTQLLAHRPVVPPEKLAPPSISQRSSALGAAEAVSCADDCSTLSFMRLPRVTPTVTG
jgi:hypothetical protein